MLLHGFLLCAELCSLKVSRGRKELLDPRGKSTAACSYIEQYSAWSRVSTVWRQTRKPTMKEKKRKNLLIGWRMASNSSWPEKFLDIFYQLKRKKKTTKKEKKTSVHWPDSFVSSCLQKSDIFEEHELSHTRN